MNRRTKKDCIHFDIETYTIFLFEIGNRRAVYIKESGTNMSKQVDLYFILKEDDIHRFQSID